MQVDLCIREALPGERARLAVIYRRAALELGPAAYSLEQARHWATYADTPEFREQLRQGVVLVAALGDELVAFAQLHPEDHLSLLYTAPEYCRRGCAARLCAAVEERARLAGSLYLFTEASRLSQPLLSRLGWQVDECELADYHGMKYRRYRMSKPLLADAPANR